MREPVYVQMVPSPPPNIILELIQSRQQSIRTAYPWLKDDFNSVEARLHEHAEKLKNMDSLINDVPLKKKVLLELQAKQHNLWKPVYIPADQHDTNYSRDFFLRSTNTMSRQKQQPATKLSPYECPLVPIKSSSKKADSRVLQSREDNHSRIKVKGSQSKPLMQESKSVKFKVGLPKTRKVDNLVA